MRDAGVPRRFSRRWNRAPLDLEIPDPRVAPQRDATRHGRRRDTGQRAHALEKSVVESDDAIGLAVVGGGQRHRAHHDPVRIESRIDGEQPIDAADHQAGAHDEHDREGDLERHKAAAQPEARAGPARRMAAFAKRGLEIDGGAAQRRNQAEQHDRAHGDTRGEQQHPPVEGDFAGARDARRIEGNHRPDARVCEADTERAAQRAEQRAFDERQTDQATAPGAKRAADRHLACPGLAARHDDVGHVGADDEQHEPGGAEQQQQGRPHPPCHVVQQGPEKEVVARVDVRESRLPAVHQRAHLHAGLFNRRAVGQPADRAESRVTCGCRDWPDRSRAAPRYGWSCPGTQIPRA